MDSVRSLRSLTTPRQLCVRSCSSDSSTGAPGSSPHRGQVGFERGLAGFLGVDVGRTFGEERFGERRTLRLVAQYADACNVLVPDPGESRRKVEVLKAHCEAIGRDVAEIETTALLEADLSRETPTALVTRIREQAEEGIEHVIVNMPDAHDVGRLNTFGSEVIPAVAEAVPV